MEKMEHSSEYRNFSDHIRKIFSLKDNKKRGVGGEVDFLNRLLFPLDFGC